MASGNWRSQQQPVFNIALGKQMVRVAIFSFHTRDPLRSGTVINIGALVVAMAFAFFDPLTVCMWLRLFFFC